MAYTTLLVHLELGHSNAGLLQVARETAARFDAHVIGITGSQPFELNIREGDGEDFIESSIDEIAGEVRAAEATFREALASGVRSVEWRSTALCASIADFVADAARGADLILTGATTYELADAQRHANRGDLLMRAGRPLLVVPQAPVVSTVGNVLIAWKDTREARRAVLDALPLLKRAAYVTLVELTTDANLAEAHDRLTDVARWLKRHDIHAEVRATVSQGNDPKQLDAIANEQAADVIVAGAYGHSRLREWAFGGMTRELLRPSARCAFLSH